MRAAPPRKNPHLAVDDMDIAVAESRALDTDEDLASRRLGRRNLFENKGLPVFVQPCGFHGRLQKSSDGVP